MKDRRVSRLLSIVACGLFTFLAAWIGFAQQTRQPDANALRNAAKSSEWLTYGGNYAETRYSPLRQIDASNVGRLGLAWTYVVGSGGGNQEATPLFSNGVLYGITNWSIAFAVEAKTGRELWRFDPAVDPAFAAAGTNRGVCCGILNRGLALYEGKVIVPVLDGRLIALDAATGKTQWSSRILPENSTGYSVTMAPRVVKDKVIIGFAGADFTPIADSSPHTMSTVGVKCGGSTLFPEILQSLLKIPHSRRPPKHGRASGGNTAAEARFGMACRLIRKLT